MSLAPRSPGLLRSQGRNAVLGAAGLLAVVVVAEVLPRSGAVDARFIPPFSDIATVLIGQLGEGAFWVALGQTLTGWIVGLAIAMAGGIAVGGFLGTVPFARNYTASTIEFLRPIPSVALIPLVVLLFGSRPPAALVLVVYAAFFQILIQVIYGLADVDPVVRDTGRAYRFSRFTMGTKVLWPTALPYIVTGFRLAAWVALIIEITAELVIGVPGLGRTIGIAQASGAVPETYALVIVVGLIGVAVNQCTSQLQRRILSWHPSTRKDL
ncbi:ABC transporter permease [Arthrobacter sp. MA-N2]|uniref:ABC transporter permease n=1 Tax=Arthrobacter sp. MA-N2 TaxID=1101188 RepID=UPI001E2E3185|nr:ABC transporter permease [Arthrobacter sp. MA-N2]